MFKRSGGAAQLGRYLAAIGALLLAATIAPSVQAASFVAFESGHVRPLAL